MTRFPRLIHRLSIRFAALLCICTLAVSGCSGSSGSGQNDIQASSENAESTADGDSGTSNVGSGMTDMESVSDLPVGGTDSQSNEATIDDTQLSTLVAPNPSSPATIRVDFEITVPVVMSNQLQVRLNWGLMSTTAAWLRDETWAVSENFPANTENLLLVTFADRNGAITLGTVENTFRTTTGESQNIEINAGQFNTEQWDSDDDGVSNLDELIVGSDPFSSDMNVDINPLPTGTLLPVSASVELIPAKTFRIRWQPTSAAGYYRVWENPDGVSGFTAITGELEASTEFYDHRVALHKRVNARYMVEACHSEGCTLSAQQFIEGNLTEAIGYLKASNPDSSDRFGATVSLSGNGTTLAVGAPGESSTATGINGDQSEDSAENAGAVYIFTRSGNGWQQQAYLKASNTDSRDAFGAEISLSADGNTLAVGSPVEASNASGVNGDQSDNSVFTAGAVYVFVRNTGNWKQQAYLKASNTNEFDDTRNRFYGQFGLNISLSADGNTLAVGAMLEESAALGINGDQDNNDAPNSGAVYVFTRSNAIWQQQAYIKASRKGSRNFGSSVSLSADGNALAVGQIGAVHMFSRTSGNWQEQALVGEVGGFPIVSLSGDGNTVAVAAGTIATIFENISGSWQEMVTFNQFGQTADFNGLNDGISLSADGSTLALGNSREGSGQIGLQGFQGVQPQVKESGAVFVFTRGDGSWQQEVYVKASNTSSTNRFGNSVSLSENGDTLVVGARFESGASVGFNGDQSQAGGGGGSGAVYLY